MIYRPKSKDSMVLAKFTCLFNGFVWINRPHNHWFTTKVFLHFLTFWIFFSNVSSEFNTLQIRWRGRWIRLERLLMLFLHQNDMNHAIWILKLWINAIFNENKKKEIYSNFENVLENILNKIGSDNIVLQA